MAAIPAHAEQVAKKWRLSVAGGVFNPQDEIPSDAGNVLGLYDENFNIQFAYLDPRDDSSVFGSLDIQPAPLVAFAAQYAMNNILVLEGSVGYEKGDVGDIEMQVEFLGVRNTLPNQLDFGFSTFRIPAGELERIPIQLTAMGRFRPRARLNPYFGAGVGYAIIGFEPSNELNTISARLDNSSGAQTAVTDSLNANPTFVEVGGPVDLRGAAVEARDTFEWHAAGGAEFTFRPSWAVFLDARFSMSSRQLRVGFNGQEDLGRSVPQRTDFVNSPVSFGVYGPVLISEGGLIDGGMTVLRPVPQAPIDTDCQVQPQLCREEFIRGALDGELDPGYYYLQGGEVNYDGLSVLIGVRKTF